MKKDQVQQIYIQLIKMKKYQSIMNKIILKQWDYFKVKLLILMILNNKVKKIKQ